MDNNGWISVDSPPDELCECVLGWENDGGVCVGLFDGKQFVDKDMWQFVFPPTHWQPLPPPPTKL